MRSQASALAAKEAGNAIQTVQSGDPVKVVTVRGASFEATGTQAPAPIETAGAAADPGVSAWVEDKVASSDRPEARRRCGRTG